MTEEQFIKIIEHTIPNRFQIRTLKKRSEFLKERIKSGNTCGYLTAELGAIEATLNCLNHTTDYFRKKQVFPKQDLA
jgi:hypothetical protein